MTGNGIGAKEAGAAQGADNARLHRPFGSAAEGPWQVSITPRSAGWSLTGLRVADLEPGGAVAFSTGPNEVLVLPLSGSCVVEAAGMRAELRGRADVFAGPTDFLYLPRDTDATLASAGGGRFAVPGARARRRLPPRHVDGRRVSSEARGAGICSRLVRNYCMPEQMAADRLMVCEVITPGGNWSSFPPHKHDEDRPGEESVLEEIYYFEVADGPHGPGSAYQRVYGSSPDRPLDVLAEVGGGDVVLVPHGWHGPAMATPGYDLYYLNAMAGPGERVWHICDDPAHAWVRGTWADQPVDPRVLNALAERRTA
ncbi:MAG TPA: 5-deoxy-glucuronate isomerase [Actinocrinis sp.]|jgi:5-deoxy-glucuronate isomerase